MGGAVVRYASPRLGPVIGAAWHLVRAATRPGLTGLQHRRVPGDHRPAGAGPAPGRAAAGRGGDRHPPRRLHRRRPRAPAGARARIRRGPPGARRRRRTGSARRRRGVDAGRTRPPGGPGDRPDVHLRALHRRGRPPLPLSARPPPRHRRIHVRPVRPPGGRGVHRPGTRRAGARGRRRRAGPPPGRRHRVPRVGTLHPGPGPLAGPADGPSGTGDPRGPHGPARADLPAADRPAAGRHRRRPAEPGPPITHRLPHRADRRHRAVPEPDDRRR